MIRFRNPSIIPSSRVHAPTAVPTPRTPESSLLKSEPRRGNVTHSDKSSEHAKGNPTETSQIERLLASPEALSTLAKLAAATNNPRAGILEKLSSLAREYAQTSNPESKLAIKQATRSLLASADGRSALADFRTYADLAGAEFKESKNFKTIEPLVDFLRGFLGSSDARRLLPLAPQEQAKLRRLIWLMDQLKHTNVSERAYILSEIKALVESPATARLLGRAKDVRQKAEAAAKISQADVNRIITSAALLQALAKMAELPGATTEQLGRLASLAKRHAQAETLAEKRLIEGEIREALATVSGQKALSALKTYVDLAGDEFQQSKTFKDAFNLHEWLRHFAVDDEQQILQLTPAQRKVLARLVSLLDELKSAQEADRSYILLDLPLFCHPAAIRASADFALGCAVGARGDLRSWFGLRS